MEVIPISQLRPYPKNPREIRRSDLDKLKRSIDEFPQMLLARPLVVDADNVVLGGNMRLLAMKELGYKEVNAIRVGDWPESLREKFVLLDNVHAGNWDYDILANSWGEVATATDFVPAWPDLREKEEGEYQVTFKSNNAEDVDIVRLMLVESVQNETIDGTIE